MRLTGIYLRTSDFSRMLGFYRDVLSMETERAGDGYVCFSSGLCIEEGEPDGCTEMQFEARSISMLLSRLRLSYSDTCISLNEKGQRVLTLEDPDHNIVHVAEAADRPIAYDEEIHISYKEGSPLCSHSGYILDDDASWL